MTEHHKITPPVLTKYKPKTLVLVFILVVVSVAAVALVRFELKYKNRFYPGISVGGESVGGQTYEEALNHFNEKVDALQKNGLNINFETSKGTQQVSVPISQSGLTPDNSVEYFTIGDWKNDLEVAYQWGHGPNFIRRVKEQSVLLFLSKKNFNFSTIISRDAVGSFLESNIYSYFKKSVPAYFSFIDSKISISTEVAGESIDKEKVLDTLEKKLTRLDITPETFKVDEEIPSVTKTKLEPFSDFAENFSKKINVVLKYNGHEWKIKGSKLVTWLTLDKHDSLSIDATILDQYLTNTVAKYIDNPPENSRFEMEDGKLVETVAGHAGFVVDNDDVLKNIDKIVTDMNSKDFTGTVSVSIKTIEVEPKVTNESVRRYHIKDLVGEMRTSFKGSTLDREHNIKIGVAAINGMLIAPGAEFSTVSSIGPVTEKEGYVKELVIKEHETTKEYGGGLCQVATTLFRLALNAGLPITERQNHRFVIHYYDPPGLDATIYGPHPDFRFVNDTNNYLLLQARVENKQVIMELYGQKDGRSSEISQAIVSNPIPAPETKYVPSTEIPPGQTKCTESPHDGVTTDVIYSVNYPDGTLKEKNFHSIYQPWQKVCLVGTAL